MGRKRDRQEALAGLLQQRELHTQEEVSEALAELGYDAHQGTVSRDLREIGAVRGVVDGRDLARELVTSEDRDVYYLPPDACQRSRRQAAARLDAVLRQHATGVESYEPTHYVLVRCEPGRALRVSRAIVASEIDSVIAALPSPGDRVLVLLDDHTRTAEVGARLDAAVRGLPPSAASSTSALASDYLAVS